MMLLPDQFNKNDSFYELSALDDYGYSRTKFYFFFNILTREFLA